VKQRENKDDVYIIDLPPFDGGLSIPVLVRDTTCTEKLRLEEDIKTHVQAQLNRMRPPTPKYDPI
jgi:hypothetical protein